MRKIELRQEIRNGLNFKGKILRNHRKQDVFTKSNLEETTGKI
jgi:hypothetical protein